MWSVSSLGFKLLTASIAAVHASSAPYQQPLGYDAPISDSRSRPNIVFVLTDDQDVHLSSLDYMPLVKKHLLDQGGYPKFVTQGFNENYLPVWLQKAGYNTYYTGKLFNVHTVDNYNSPYAAGFTESDFLLDPFTYNYLNSTFQHSGEAPRSYEGEYTTDVLAQKAYSLLDHAVQAETPFFLTIAPIAPHANINMNGSILDDDHVFEFGSPVSAKRHERLFKDVKVPRTESFNPDQPSGANWVLALKQQNQTNVDYNDHFYRQRLRALQAVDELIDGLFERLEQHGIMDNTYIVYSSDNGFHIGQHRLQPGKSCGYEEDINVPLIVRGPGVAKNHTTSIVTTHTDLAPTFFDLLGIPQRDDFDGTAFPVTEAGIEIARTRRREHVNVEYWGFAGGEGKYDHEILHENNTYKAIRILGPGYNLYYSIWCTNEHELYNMDDDPHQLHNILSPSYNRNSSIAGLPVHQVVARLDSLLFVLKSCTGLTCQHPWQTLHPTGDVLTLEDALAPKFDRFYEVEQPRVVYNFCSNGYLIDAEGPMWESQGSVFRDGLMWYEWV